MIKNKVLEKKRWNGHNPSDVIKLLNIHLPKCDYVYIYDLDNRISKMLNIPRTYVIKVRVENFDLPNNTRFNQEKFLIENGFEYSFPKSFFGPFKIKCVKCARYRRRHLTKLSSL